MHVKFLSIIYSRSLEMDKICYICVKMWMMGDDNSSSEERMFGAFGSRTLNFRL